MPDTSKLHFTMKYSEVRWNKWLVVFYATSRIKKKIQWVITFMAHFPLLLLSRQWQKQHNWAITHRSERERVEETNERIRETLEDCVLSRAIIRIEKCQFHSNIVHINCTVKIYRLKNCSVFMQIIVSNTSGSKQFWFI